MLRVQQDRAMQDEVETGVPVGARWVEAQPDEYSEMVRVELQERQLYGKEARDQQFAAAICEALGLNASEVMRLVITIDNPAVIKVEATLVPRQGEDVVAVMQSYRWVVEAGP